MISRTYLNDQGGRYFPRTDDPTLHTYFLSLWEQFATVNWDGVVKLITSMHVSKRGRAIVRIGPVIEQLINERYKQEFARRFLEPTFLHSFLVPALASYIYDRKLVCGYYQLTTRNDYLTQDDSYSVPTLSNLCVKHDPHVSGTWPGYVAPLYLNTTTIIIFEDEGGAIYDLVYESRHQ